MKLTAKEHRKIAQSYFDNGNLDSSHIKFSTAKKVGDWIFIKEDQEVLLYFLKNTYCEAETGWDSKSFDWSQKNLNKLVHEYVKKTSSNAEYMEYLGYEFCLVSNQKEDIPISKHKHGYDDYPYNSENGYVVVIPFKKEHLLLVKNFLITYQITFFTCKMDEHTAYKNELGSMRQRVYAQMAVVRQRNREIAHNLKHKCVDTGVEPLPIQFRSTRISFTKSPAKMGD